MIDFRNLRGKIIYTKPHGMPVAAVPHIVLRHAGDGSLVLLSMPTVSFPAITTVDSTDVDILAAYESENTLRSVLDALIGLLDTTDVAVSLMGKEHVTVAIQVLKELLQPETPDLRVYYGDASPEPPSPFNFSFIVGM